MPRIYDPEWIRKLLALIGGKEPKMPIDVEDRIVFIIDTTDQLSGFTGRTVVLPATQAAVTTDVGEFYALGNLAVDVTVANPFGQMQFSIRNVGAFPRPCTGMDLIAFTVAQVAGAAPYRLTASGLRAAGLVQTLIPVNTKTGAQANVTLQGSTGTAAAQQAGQLAYPTRVYLDTQITTTVQVSFGPPLPAIGQLQPPFANSDGFMIECNPIPAAAASFRASMLVRMRSEPDLT